MTISRELLVDTEGVSYPAWAVEAVRHGALVALNLLAPDIGPSRALLTPERAPGEPEIDLDAWAGAPPTPPAVAFTYGRILSVSYPAAIEAAGSESPAAVRPILLFAAGAGVGRIAAGRGSGVSRLRMQRSVDADMNIGIVAHYAGIAASGWHTGVAADAVFFFLNHLRARAAMEGARAIWTGPLGWSVRKLAEQLRLAPAPGHFDATGVPLARLSDIAALLRYVAQEGPWPVAATA